MVHDVLTTLHSVHAFCHTAEGPDTVTLHGEIVDESDEGTTVNVKAVKSDGTIAVQGQAVVVGDGMAGKVDPYGVKLL
jgi:hypothetical protein